MRALLGIAGSSRSAQFVVALFSLLLSGCGEKWKITKVLVNPQPIGGTDPIVPVTVFAPGPTGAVAQVSVAIEVDLQRDSQFQGEIRGVVNTSFTDPNGNRSAGQNPLFFTNNQSSVISSFLTVTCTKTSTTTVELKVRALNAGVTTSGTTQATTSVGIGVGTDVIDGNTFPISWGAPHPLAISCVRDNIIN